MAEAMNVPAMAVKPFHMPDGPFVSQTGGAANPKVYGKTYGEWSAAWWQWAASFPSDMNPLTDETGEFCDLGQSGPVWFLAGTLGGEAERSCTIPAGKALFYPLVNVVWIDCPPPSTDADISDEDVRFILAAYTAAGDSACQLTSTIDSYYSELFGTDIPQPISALLRPAVRSQSPVFRVNLPEDSILGGSCDPALEPGLTGRSISEGYWVMLPPLEVGEHVLTLHGAGCAGGEPFFETGVTYHLTVVPGKRK
jgi:hypothetical protein